jgi:hypothetical protein
MLNVVVLDVVMLNVANKPFKQGVVMLSVGSIFQLCRPNVSRQSGFRPKAEAP